METYFSPDSWGRSNPPTPHPTSVELLMMLWGVEVGRGGVPEAGCFLSEIRLNRSGSGSRSCLREARTPRHWLQPLSSALASCSRLISYCRVKCYFQKSLGRPLGRGGGALHSERFVSCGKAVRSSLCEPRFQMTIGFAHSPSAPVLDWDVSGVWARFHSSSSSHHSNLTEGLLVSSDRSPVVIRGGGGSGKPRWPSDCT